MIEDEERTERESSWKERLRALRDSGRRLFRTRAEIFFGELGEKSGQLGRALAGFGLALVFGCFTMFLLTALIAALLSRLFGSALLGVSATLVLYGAAAAGSVLFGGKAFSRIRPFEFPVTANEIRKDVKALKTPDPLAEVDTKAPSGPAPEDLEARFREGSE